MSTLSDFAWTKKSENEIGWKEFYILLLASKEKCKSTRNVLLLTVNFPICMQFDVKITIIMDWGRAYDLIWCTNMRKTVCNLQLTEFA